jgi:hypothetical protein
MLSIRQVFGLLVPYEEMYIDLNSQVCFGVAG